MSMEWTKTKDKHPEKGQTVQTKIDDSLGLRHEKNLVYHSNLWWDEDFNMYVYYEPTHWKPLEP